MSKNTENDRDFYFCLGNQEVFGVVFVIFVIFIVICLYAYKVLEKVSTHVCDTPIDFVKV